MQDIREIMNSMKNLSLMETRKLSHFLSSQQRVVKSTEQAAKDFLSAYPEMQISSPAVSQVYILIGSEQGFCGDFNQALIDTYNAIAAEKSTDDIKLVAIGMKLSNLLQDHPQLVKALTGPTVGQEVDTILTELVNTVSGLHNTLHSTLNSSLKSNVGSLSIAALHHEHESENIQITSLLPPFQNLKLPSSRTIYPPHLQLPPEHFYKSLVDHYLFAALYEMFYTSLMAEHYRRIQHLESAIDRLEQRADELGKKRNILRQEEITEEIEVIMLSAGIVE
jgi:F-type H+-transporting ATPase subunit gamma